MPSGFTADGGRVDAPTGHPDGLPQAPTVQLGRVGTDQPRSRYRWSRGWRLGVPIAALVVLAATGVVADALSIPGNDSAPAKLAEWGRDHGLGPLITWLEQLQYQQDPPPIGGIPPGGIPAVAGAVTGQSAAVSSTRLPSTPMPAPPGLVPLAGEGIWHTVVTDGGRPAVQVTAVRPDTRHTSFVVGVLRMDPALVRGRLHPGTRDPGGTWQAPNALTGAATRGLAVAFNGGFRLSDPSRPGYFSEGRAVTPLVVGQASLVLHTDGHAEVGTWNQEVRMGPTVASVRQNLQMLVDNGQVNPTCATGGTKEWGSTIGQAAYIHRSGFGTTATGVEVYVGGPALSVCSLGDILRAAGVIRGMELDINPNWVSGTYYHPRPDGGPPRASPCSPPRRSPRSTTSPRPAATSTPGAPDSPAGPPRSQDFRHWRAPRWAARLTGMADDTVSVARRAAAALGRRTRGGRAGGRRRTHGRAEECTRRDTATSGRQRQRRHSPTSSYPAPRRARRRRIRGRHRGRPLPARRRPGYHLGDR